MNSPKWDDPNAIRTTEAGYYLVSALIELASEGGWELAQKIELDIWRTDASGEKDRLLVYLEALGASSSPEDARSKFAEIVYNNGMEYRVAPTTKRVSWVPTADNRYKGEN